MKRGFAGLRRAIRGVRTGRRSGGFILLYHRVGESPTDPQQLAVTPAHFAEHLQVLRDYGRAIPLRQLSDALRERSPLCGNPVLTFDDGYADNLHYAKPLLERYDTPATVFVTSGRVGTDGEFWWDDLDRLLLQPGTVPNTLRLDLDGSSYHWQLDEASHYDEEAFRRNRGWSALEASDPGSRQRVYRSLCALLRPLPEELRRTAQAELQAWAGSTANGRPSHRTLSEDEVRRLADGGLVEIGAHTVSHPVLSALSERAQKQEITESRSRLEAILGHPVESFAYPYGTRADYLTATAHIAREAGFTSACSNFEGIIGANTDPYQLPRFVVRNWDGQEFDRQLGEWLRNHEDPDRQ